MTPACPDTTVVLPRVPAAAPPRRGTVLMVGVDRPTDLDATTGDPARVADVLRAGVGAHGTVRRWGRAEFLVLLPLDGIGPANRTAEALRESIADLGVTGPTVSIGVAVGAFSDRTLTATVWDADSALYAAKRAGGNTVRVAAG